MGWTVYDSSGNLLSSIALVDNVVATAKIADDAVTYAKMQNLATADRVLGSASTGVIGEVQVVADMIATDAVTNVKVATGIDAVKLADGSVTNTELQYINTLSSNAQTQIAAKAAVGSGTPSTQTLPDTAATGSSTEAARLDHVHTMPAGGSNSFTNDVTVTSGNFVIGTAGKGIDFSAQTGITSTGTTVSELLDHYEEGTFTPGISDNSLDPEGNDKSQAYLSNGQVGRYVRIGRTVFIHGWVDLTSHSMQTSDRANLVGLPFTSLTLTNYRASIVCGEGGDMAITATATPSGRIVANVAYCQMYIWDATGGISAFTVAKLGSSGNFSFTGYYEV